jgi:imidazole glycerol-phosphate synthase subunit HisF
MKSRIIARLDIKKDRLIKGIHLEGLRVVGDPVERAKNYYQQGADELLLIDAVASLYQRNQLTTVVQNICKEIFVPITVGGGIKSLEDAQALFDAGADKIAINTAAIDNPTLLEQLSCRFGSQAIVLSVQAKKSPRNSLTWLAMTDGGRENSGRDVFEWVHLARQYGVGEILLTSIDQEGTGSGFDIDLNSLIASSTDCPVLASGGFDHPDHATAVLQAGAQAVVVAQALHYDKITIHEIKDSLSSQSISVRSVGKVS